MIQKRRSSRVRCRRSCGSNSSRVAARRRCASESKKRPAFVALGGVYDDDALALDTLTSPVAEAAVEPATISALGSTTSETSGGARNIETVATYAVDEHVPRRRALMRVSKARLGSRERSLPPSRAPRAVGSRHARFHRGTRARLRCREMRRSRRRLKNATSFFLAFSIARNASAARPHFVIFLALPKTPPRFLWARRLRKQRRIRETRSSPTIWPLSP